MELAFLHFLGIVCFLHSFQHVEVKFLAFFDQEHIIIVNMGTGEIEIGYFLLECLRLDIS
jgi:hypothetical protein